MDEPGDPADFRCYHPYTQHRREPLGNRAWRIEILCVRDGGLEWFPGYVSLYGQWTSAHVEAVGWKVVGWREPGGPGQWESHDGRDTRNWPKHLSPLLPEALGAFSGGRLRV